MTGVITISILFLILPYPLAFIHSIVNKKINPILLYYRYFLTFNIIFTGFIVASRMFFDGPLAAHMSGWQYSPVFHLYGVAILSMVILAILTAYSRRIIMLAPAICWATFLILSTVSLIYQLMNHQLNDIDMIYVHIVFNLVVAIVLLRFANRINNLFRKQIAENQSATATN